VPLFLLAWRRHPSDALTIELRRGAWVMVYLVVLLVVSALGSFDGSETIGAPWDTVSVGVLAVFVYVDAVRSSRRYIATGARVAVSEVIISLVWDRNQVRDYLDVAAMAERLGVTEAAAALCGVDGYYLDRSEEDDSVATVLVQRLAEPNPKDRTVIRQLSDYKGLTGKWQDWAVVTAACNDLAQRMLEGPAE